MAERQIDLSEVIRSFLEAGSRANGDAPSRFVLSANGASMVPTIVRGDRIHLEASPEVLGKLTHGDIVLARDALGRYLIHRIRVLQPAADSRVRDRSSPRIITRGDALDQDDPPIARVLAKVTRIERTWRSRLRRLYIRSHALSP